MQNKLFLSFIKLIIFFFEIYLNLVNDKKNLEMQKKKKYHINISFYSLLNYTCFIGSIKLKLSKFKLILISSFYFNKVYV